MCPAVMSTPHANTQIFGSMHEGAELIPKFMDTESEDIQFRRNLAKEQTGIEIPLRASSAFSAPTNPWPKKSDSLTKKNAFAKKRKSYWRRPEQGNNWDQNGDSSSAASASASAEEGGTEPIA